MASTQRITVAKGSNLNSTFNVYIKNNQLSGIVDVPSLFNTVLQLNRSSQSVLLRSFNGGEPLKSNLKLIMPTLKYYNANYLRTSAYYQYAPDSKGIRKASGLRSVGLFGTKHGRSFFQRVSPSGERYEAPLAVLPEEFSESNSAVFNSVSLMGRSVDYQIYEGSSREVSFTLKLHQEIFSSVAASNRSYLHHIYNIVQLIESSCYPYYNQAYAWAGPPQVVFQIGDQFYIKGILTSCNVTWKLPVDQDGYYTNCDLSVSVRETTGPWSVFDIYDSESKGKNMGSFRDGSSEFDRKGT